MGEQNIYLHEVKHLYQAALNFKTLKCWEWMYDSDIFGIENPANGEIGYCCVMGNLGEVFALAVYSGSEGLEGYLKTVSGKIDPNDMNALHFQDCLMASFENRDYLAKKDLNIIKSLGLKFRGKNEWPLFRNYKPGFHPWYLKRNEVNYLTLVLEQATDICQKFKENQKLFNPPQKGYYFVRTAGEKNGKIHWNDQWFKPEPFRAKQKICPDLDELSLRRIKKNAQQSHRIWELDFFYSPFGINEGERPYFPFIFLIVDHDSQELINFHITNHTTYEREFFEKFLHTIQNDKYLPRSLLVKRAETHNLFSSIAQQLNIKIDLKNALASLEETQEDMFQYFSKRF